MGGGWGAGGEVRGGEGLAGGSVSDYAHGQNYPSYMKNRLRRVRQALAVPFFHHYGWPVSREDTTAAHRFPTASHPRVSSRRTLVARLAAPSRLRTASRLLARLRIRRPAVAPTIAVIAIITEVAPTKVAPRVLSNRKLREFVVSDHGQQTTTTVLCSGLKYASYTGKSHARPRKFG